MLRRWLLTIGLAGAACPAVAQPPGGEVMTIRTAGQPDRKVRVLKTDTLPDGTVLKDVKDEATGLVYTIADGPAAALPPTTAPRPPVATPPVAAPQPQSRPLNTAFPTTAATPRPATTAVASPRVPAAQASAPKPERAEPQSGIHKLLFGELTPKPAAPAPPRTAQAAPPASRPAAVGERMPLHPQPAAKVALTPPPMAPRADAPMLSLATPPEPVPMRTAVAERPPLVAPPAVRPLAEPVPVPAGFVVPVGAVVESPLTPDQQMRAETGPILQELKTHLRPSYRIEMANALAEGRYASQDDVKRALAAAASSDPSPQVRGHCVRLLGQLGYADPAFVANLPAWQASDEPAVRLAAADAAARLAPRR